VRRARKDFFDFRPQRFSCILVIEMAKRKKESFSATKAVKANARERVGQPKPSRVLPDAPRTGRKAKYKPRIEEILREEE
jgi:hypothetical protein